MAPQLPIELVLRILESLEPADLAICPSVNAAGRTIRAFTRVSRATYPLALRMLYKHCLWIDSSQRLSSLLLSLSKHIRYDEENITENRNKPRTVSTLPQVDIQVCLQNLYLKPYERYSIDNLPVAQWIYELFSIARHTLRRLVIDIHLRSLRSEDDHLNVRPRLRAAFEELTSLEEFTSTNDELFLSLRTDWTINEDDVSKREPPAWSKWSKLKHLALYNVDLDSPDYRLHLLSSLPSLETLVLTRPDGNAASWMGFLRSLAPDSPDSNALSRTTTTTTTGSSPPPLSSSYSSTSYPPSSSANTRVSTSSFSTSSQSSTSLTAPPNHNEPSNNSPPSPSSTSPQDLNPSSSITKLDPVQQRPRKLTIINLDIGIQNQKGYLPNLCTGGSDVFLNPQGRRLITWASENKSIRNDIETDLELKPLTAGIIPLRDYYFTEMSLDLVLGRLKLLVKRLAIEGTLWDLSRGGDGGSNDNDGVGLLCWRETNLS